MTPKLPSVRELARELRAFHDGFAKNIGLYRSLEGYWHLRDAGERTMFRYVAGSEYLPGGGADIDYTAAARRLLSDARSSMKGMRLHD